MFPLPTNKLSQFPNGRWGFVGRCDPRLIFVEKDGSPLKDETIVKLVGCSNPAMVAKARAWTTKDEALAYAESIGQKVTL